RRGEGRHPAERRRHDARRSRRDGCAHPRAVAALPDDAKRIGLACPPRADVPCYSRVIRSWFSEDSMALPNADVLQRLVDAFLANDGPALDALFTDGAT